LPQTLRFVQSLPKREKIPLAQKLRTQDPDAIDLLDKMLVFDPRTRVTATESLAHTYVAPYHDPTDEPEAGEKFDWSFNDADLPVDTWKVMMYSEILGACRGPRRRRQPPAHACAQTSTRSATARSKPAAPSPARTRIRRERARRAGACGPARAVANGRAA
jgi:serine/threonine protein kinase